MDRQSFVAVAERISFEAQNCGMSPSVSFLNKDVLGLAEFAPTPKHTRRSLGSPSRDMPFV